MKTMTGVWVGALLALAGCRGDDAEATADAAVAMADAAVEGMNDAGAAAGRTLPASLTWVDVPGGTFTMGGPSRDGDSPEVSVTISPFRMAATEITNVQYIAFLNAALVEGWVAVEPRDLADPCGQYTEDVVVGVGAAPHAGEIYLQLGETGGCTSGGEAEHLDNRSWIDFDGGAFVLLDADKADWPVNWVKWFGADAFAAFYDDVALPSEAQWEYAARGGQQLQYPTADGTLSAAQANYNGDQPGVYNADGHSVAVASYAANPFGLYDLGGNVWEWCADHYAADAYMDGATDPVHTVAGPDAKRVRRGGSWNYHSATLQSHARASDFPDRGNNHFGFRVVAPAR